MGTEYENNLNLGRRAGSTRGWLGFGVVISARQGLTIEYVPRYRTTGKNLDNLTIMVKLNEMDRGGDPEWMAQSWRVVRISLVLG